MMNRKNILDTKALCLELASLCDDALDRLDDEIKKWNDGEDMRKKMNNIEPTYRLVNLSDVSFGSKETGALRRRSMDLTRQLAKLRGRNA